MVAPAPRDEDLGELLASATSTTEHSSGLSDLIDALLAARPFWMRDALCAEYPDVNFFPTKGEDTTPAKQVCARCITKAECRAWALEQGAGLDGIWAGTVPRQRAQMRAAPPAVPVGPVTVATGPPGRSTAA